MSFFRGTVAGGLGGLASAAAAHVVVTLLLRGLGQDFLKGPYGPHFMPIAAYMAVLMGGTALSLSLRPRPAAAAFLAPLLGIAAPMFVLTRTVSWGMTDAASTPTTGWFLVVSALYIVCTWGTMALIGALLGERRAWGALAAPAGGFLGYLLLAGLMRLAPNLQTQIWKPSAFLPNPVSLLDGMLTGAGIGVGLATLTWLTHRGEHEKARNP